MYNMVIYRDKFNGLISAEPINGDGVAPKSGEMYKIGGRDYEVLLVDEDSNAKVLTLTLSPLN